MTTIFVGIDPSPLHTAFAIIERNDTGVLAIRQAQTLEILPAAQYMTNLMHQWADSDQRIVLILERPPWSPRGAAVESQQTIASYWMLRWIIKAFGRTIHDIAPGSWKPAAKGWKIEYPKELTDKHQRDAYAMTLVTMQGKKYADT